VTPRIIEERPISAGTQYPNELYKIKEFEQEIIIWMKSNGLKPMSNNPS
jgi:hypothetical protein